MILVAGAGPGGLAAALALHRAGQHVAIWERSPALRTAGAGLTLQINAMRMLAGLGVASQLRDLGSVLAVGRLTDHRDACIQEFRFARYAKRFGQPGIGIHRGELSRTLAEALPDGTITFGRSVVGVEQDETGVEVLDGTGRSKRFEAVVAADGIHSAVRSAVFGAVPLRYAGYTCWRGLADLETPEGPGHFTERWGPGVRFGSVPIGLHRTYWFATADAEAGGTDGDDPQGELVQRFADYPPPVHTLLFATPARSISRNDIFDFTPLSSWTKGRVALLGDAAHAMTPNLGQGAGQAIEDAVVLAAAVRAHGVPDGLWHYEQTRRPRAAKLVVDSHRFGALGQLRNPALRWLRNAILRLLGTERSLDRQLIPLYDVPVPSLRAPQR